MSLFIEVEIDRSRCLGSRCGKCIPVCPVGIFSCGEHDITVDLERRDECILCELCLEACPEGCITIHRLYRE